MTILISLLATKTLGFFAFLWQEAAGEGSAAANETANAFTMSEMIKNLGPVAIGVIVILLIMSMYSIAVMVDVGGASRQRFFRDRR